MLVPAGSQGGVSMHVFGETKSLVPEEEGRSPRPVRLRVPRVVLEVLAGVLVGLLIGTAGGPLVYRATRPHTSQPAMAPRSVAAQPAVAANKPAVRRVEYESVNGKPQVTIVLDQMVAYDAHRLDHPDRVYIDLHDARLAPEIAGKTIFANKGDLSTIRLAQSQPDTVRIVLDLDKRLDYAVNKQMDPAAFVLQLTPAATVKIGARVYYRGITSRAPMDAPEPLPVPQTGPALLLQTTQGATARPETKATQMPQETQHPQNIQLEAPK